MSYHDITTCHDIYRYIMATLIYMQVTMHEGISSFTLETLGQCIKICLKVGDSKLGQMSDGEHQRPIGKLYIGHLLQKRPSKSS